VESKLRSKTSKYKTNVKNVPYVLASFRMSDHSAAYILLTYDLRAHPDRLTERPLGIMPLIRARIFCQAQRVTGLVCFLLGLLQDTRCYGSSSVRTAGKEKTSPSERPNEKFETRFRFLMDHSVRFEHQAELSQAELSLERYARLNMHVSTRESARFA